MIAGALLIVYPALSRTELLRLADMLSGIAADIHKGEHKVGDIELRIVSDVERAADGQDQ